MLRHAPRERAEGETERDRKSRRRKRRKRREAALLWHHRAIRETRPVGGCRDGQRAVGQGTPGEVEPLGELMNWPQGALDRSHAHNIGRRMRQRMNSIKTLVNMVSAREERCLFRQRQAEIITGPPLPLTHPAPHTWIVPHAERQNRRARDSLLQYISPQSPGLAADGGNEEQAADRVTYS